LTWQWWCRRARMICAVTKTEPNNTSTFIASQSWCNHCKMAYDKVMRAIPQKTARYRQGFSHTRLSLFITNTAVLDAYYPWCWKWHTCFKQKLAWIVTYRGIYQHLAIHKVNPVLSRFIGQNIKHSKVNIKYNFTEQLTLL